ncbi:MAG: adenylate/guanylate cyclase domain-containing protein, partial [Chloroflexi bacterium]|nr:adenylate/guanylate cyclase domain-containing protein [Chloroflexota bacterium]
PSELGLAFKSVTLLFSDLKGSTALYERVGDIRAYEIVRAHFKLLRDIVADSGGAVVKTMGDAVMASFADPAPALAAALQMNREICQVGAEEDLVLKIGLHAGPCIAVDSNERLDYFGQTVNIAARVQGLADGSEIVITQPIYDAPGARELIAASHVIVSADDAVLRGMDRPTTFYRLCAE